MGTSEVGQTQYSGQHVIETENCATGEYTSHGHGGAYTWTTTGTITGNHITGNLFVQTVMDSLPEEPAERASYMSKPSIKELMDHIGKLEAAEHAACSRAAANLPRVVAAKARQRTTRNTVLGSFKRKKFAAGATTIKLPLDRKLVAKLTKHKNSIRIAVRVKLTMPSTVIPGGYPRAVVETVTLRRGKKRRTG